MKTTIYRAGKLMKAVLLFVFVLSFKLNAQEEGNKGISIYQDRYVPSDQVEEFISRETKYCSKVAENEITKGNLTFSGL